MSDSDVIEIAVSEEQLPRFDPSHGTPHPMVRRLLTIRVNEREAHFEQTDYGHPGRFNPWTSRGIAVPLQPRTDELRAICESVSRLLS
jgi:hypothetical protein